MVSNRSQSCQIMQDYLKRFFYHLFVVVFVFIELIELVIQLLMVKLINNYTLIEKIGEGSFSEVYRAINTKKMGEFAVKIIPVEKYQENIQLESCTLNQIQTLTNMAPSQYIVKYEEHFQTKHNYYFVYEYCNGGNLHEALKLEGTFAEKKALKIFRQLMEAFKVLNRYNIMHRDIKPENIFLSNGKVKLGDFGLCKGLKPGQHTAKTTLGSPIYMAPEVLRGQTYTMKADIWSLGVVLYQMLFGVCPYMTKSIATLISHINTKDITMPTDKHPVSQKTQKLIRKLLTKDYFRRLSWIELFAYKIDQEGNFIEASESGGPRTPYGSNKSYSTIRDEGEAKAIDRSAETAGKQYGSVNKDPKMRFYSEKYMNLVSQPILSSASNGNGRNGTQRKISIFNDNFLEDMKLRCEETKQVEVEWPKSELQMKDMLTFRDNSKRAKLLRKHQDCMKIMNEALVGLEMRTKESLVQAYLALAKVHLKLKQITQGIKVSETDLLDVASLINYQIIQVDRQLIETKQEILRRKMNIPNLPKENKDKIMTAKSLGGEYGIQVRQFLTLCTTEQS